MHISWDSYYMQIARVVASRSTCDLRHAGTVLVQDNRIVATGYNDSPPGIKSCKDVGHLINGQSIQGEVNEGFLTDEYGQLVKRCCERIIHSEANAICQAARHGVSLQGAHAFVTLSPCHDCFKLLLSAGISRVVFDVSDGNSSIFNLAKQAGIELKRLEASIRPDKMYQDNTRKMSFSENCQDKQFSRYSVIQNKT